MKGAEDRIRNLHNKNFTLKLNVFKETFAEKDVVWKVVERIVTRLDTLEKKEPAETEGDSQPSSKLKKRVRELTERVEKAELRLGRSGTLKEDIISEATSEGENFNQRLCLQFVNAAQLTSKFKQLEDTFKANITKLEADFKVEIKAATESISKNPKLGACEDSLLKHTNNIRAVDQRTDRQRKEQLEVNSALWNKIGNVGKDIDNLSRSAASFTTSETQKLGQQQANLSLRVDELTSILQESRAASPVTYTPVNNKDRESSDSEKELSILGICTGGE